MHLSMACPTSPPPGCTGAYRGFDKLKYQLPLHWGHYFMSNPMYSLCPYHGYLTILFLFEFSTTKLIIATIFRSTEVYFNLVITCVFPLPYFKLLFLPLQYFNNFSASNMFFSGSIHGRLILVPSEFMSTNSPHSSSFTCICISRFFSSSQPGNIRKCPKISLCKDNRLEFALTSEEIFLDRKPHPLYHILFLVTISLLIQEMRRLSLEEILCFSVYVCVQLFIVFSYLSIYFLLICYVSHQLYSWKSLYDSLF